jgi:hypothetical protein
VANILPALSGQSSENRIRDIEPGSTYIKALKERFVRATKADLDIISCYELHQTPQSEFRTDGSIVRSRMSAMNASECTARLYWANEVWVPINENHSMIEKLADREGSAYHTVVGHLARLVKASAARVSGKCPPKMYKADMEGASQSVVDERRLWSGIKGRRFYFQRVKRWHYSGKLTRISRGPTSRQLVTADEGKRGRYRRRY